MSCKLDAKKIHLTLLQTIMCFVNYHKNRFDLNFLTQVGLVVKSVPCQVRVRPKLCVLPGYQISHSKCLLEVKASPLTRRLPNKRICIEGQK